MINVDLCVFLWDGTAVGLSSVNTIVHTKMHPVSYKLHCIVSTADKPTYSATLGFLLSEHWFSTFLILRPLTQFHIVMTVPIRRQFSLLLHNCNFATMNHNVNI